MQVRIPRVRIRTKLWLAVNIRLIISSLQLICNLDTIRYVLLDEMFTEHSFLGNFQLTMLYI